MKKLISKLLLLLLVTATISSKAQTDIDVTWGKNNPNEKRSSYWLIGQTSDESVFIIKTDKKGRKYIQKYNNDDFGHDFTEQISLQLHKNSNKKSERLDLEEAYVMDDGIIIFGSNYDKKEDQFSIYARSYAFDGSENGGWEKLENVGATKRRKSGFFDIVLSPDKSKFLIKHTYPEKKSEPRRYGYSVFNSKLEKIYKKSVTFKKASKKDDIYVTGDKVSNDGSVYFFARINGDVSFYKISEGDDESLDGKDMMSYEVDFKKKYMIEMASFEDSNGNMILTGFYDDEAKKGVGISGVIYCKIKKSDFTEEVTKATPFEEEYLRNFMSKRKAKKGKGISTTFDLRHLIFNPNGDATLIAENTYVVQHCNTDPKTGITTCYYTYHNDQLMVIRIAADGNIKYAQYLPKYASAGSPTWGGSSYSVMAAGENVIIFYNDHWKNYKPGNTKIRSVPGYKKTVLVKAVINKDGEIEKEVLMRHKEAKLYIMPRYTVPTHSGKGLIMVGFYKKAMKLGRFELAN